jgi:AraC-like DNA-binding protein
MEVDQRDWTSLRFSTRELSPSKRLPALRSLFERSIRLDIEAEPEQPIEMTVHDGPGLRRAKMLSPLTARLTRPAKMLADGDDTVCLMIKTGGHLGIAQRGQEAIAQAGDGVLLVYREPALLQFVNTTYVSVRVPFSALGSIANVELAAGQRIPSDTEALALLGSYLENLPARIADPELGRLTATHIYDLIALAIGATPEGRELASRRGIRAARLEALKADLIDDTQLDLEQLAIRKGISPRYVQMLFEEAGTTFSEFALERRLDAARRMLTSPRHATWTITQIALEAGFGDLSYFNRRFKQRYQMTPSDVRAQGKRETMLNHSWAATKTEKEAK